MVGHGIFSIWKMSCGSKKRLENAVLTPNPPMASALHNGCEMLLGAIVTRAIYLFISHDCRPLCQEAMYFGHVVTSQSPDESRTRSVTWGIVKIWAVQTRCVAIYTAVYINTSLPRHSRRQIRAQLKSNSTIGWPPWFDNISHLTRCTQREERGQSCFHQKRAPKARFAF